VNELSRQKEIERMQEALKAKELNPEQVSERATQQNTH